ncbi:hypothetical protein BC940DRAFT_317215 [Gongronella butleri]|nr:hypothetical protein BC940DRAFT_317215 [Gongronella butleri]
MPFDLLLSNKKEFYIELSENKSFFPGDSIKGTVVFNVSKPIKINHVRVTLSGHIETESNKQEHVKESWFLATNPENNNKSHTLDTQVHRFPFEFIVPKDKHLPSSAPLYSLIYVKYELTAVVDRPFSFSLENMSLSSKIPIQILERINVNDPVYCIRGRAHNDLSIVGLDSTERAELALSLPKYAVVRGDVLPIEIHIKHFSELRRVNGIKLQLMRRIFTGKAPQRSERRLSERKTIKSYHLDIEIFAPTFEQEIITTVAIPTSTPPTITHECGRILSVEYALRAVINLNDPFVKSPHPANYGMLESTIVIGTFPRPERPIDDDDDDEAENASTSIEDVPPTPSTDEMANPFNDDFMAGNDHSTQQGLAERFDNMSVQDDRSPALSASALTVSTDYSSAVEDQTIDGRPSVHRRSNPATPTSTTSSMQSMSAAAATASSSAHLIRHSTAPTKSSPTTPVDTVLRANSIAGMTPSRTQHQQIYQAASQPALYPPQVQSGPPPLPNRMNSALVPSLSITTSVSSTSTSGAPGPAQHASHQPLSPQQNAYPSAAYENRPPSVALSSPLGHWTSPPAPAHTAPTSCVAPGSPHSSVHSGSHDSPHMQPHNVQPPPIMSMPMPQRPVSTEYAGPPPVMFIMPTPNMGHQHQFNQQQQHHHYPQQQNHGYPPQNMYPPPTSPQEAPSYYYGHAFQGQGYPPAPYPPYQQQQHQDVYPPPSSTYPPNSYPSPNPNAS